MSVLRIPTALLCAVAAGMTLPLWAQGTQEAFDASASSTNGTSNPSTIVIRAGRSLEERFAATGSRVIVSRQDIENMGADTVIEVLRQLPGVQVSGEGTGFPVISMRGMHSGATQILIDGERAAHGRRAAQLPLDLLPSEAIERIEVMRAPTAEFRGAIAGTINIVLRQATARTETTLNLNNQSAGERHGVGMFFSRSGPTREESTTDYKERPWTYSVGAYATQRVGGSDVDTTRQASGTLASAHLPLQNAGHYETRLRSKAGAIFPNLSGRLGGGDTIRMGMRLSTGETASQLDGKVSGSNSLGATSSTVTEYTGSAHHFASMRLDHGKRLGTARLDSWASMQRSDERTLRPHMQHDISAGTITNRSSTFDDHRSERAWTVSTKLTGARGADVWMLGAEREMRRLEVDSTTTTTSTNAHLALHTVFTRNVIWGQNDWGIAWSPQSHSTLTAGLRYEQLRLHSAFNAAAGNEATQGNRWSVAQPSLHLRTPLDTNTQWRANLARVTRNPQASDLIDRTVPSQGTNSASNPNIAGNPLLRSESSLGLDMGIERRLDTQAGQGGQLGLNVFVRRLSDVMVRQTDYDTATAVWTSKPQNVGKARTAGLEFDVKTSLRSLGLKNAPSDWRVNASATVQQSRMYASQFDGLPIPGQPRYSASLNVSKPFRRTGGWFGGGTLNLTGSADNSERSGATPWTTAIGGYNRGFETLDIFFGRVEPKLGYWRLGIGNLTNSTRTTIRTTQSAGYSAWEETRTHLPRRVLLVIGTQYCGNFQPC